MLNHIHWDSVCACVRVSIGKDHNVSMPGEERVIYRKFKNIEA